MNATPTTTSVLAQITQQRILDLCRKFGVSVRGAGATASARHLAKKDLVATLGAVLHAELPAVLAELGRDELQAACRAHGLSDAGLARRALKARLLAAAGLDAAALALAPSAPRPRLPEDLPEPGQLVLARHRQWLVEDIAPGQAGESPLIKLMCLDDDAPGKELDVLWDLELGARVLEPRVQGLGQHIDRLDPPGHFGAYLHALEWSAVSAADASRFQAPFRAGIKIMAHQLTPLMKALELPRANLFIADDVGLGKTIEAGLVLQELILRQQADFVLVVCPASVALQWRTEMQRRFGLRFEVMTRQLVGERRRERGFGVNPWATHNRFIVSHPLIRRPEYRDPLLAHLGARARKSLLILDEAHVAAPASAQKYAVDSDITRTIRDLAPRFDNRLFLSATPHNGHSNSFSALLEILDPVRFTRGVPIQGRAALAPVMVRRLKRDLRQLGVERFPRRVLVQWSLHHDPERGWRAEPVRFDAETDQREPMPAMPIAGPAATQDTRPPELELAHHLARYTELCAPERGPGRLVFINLQKRLLSSPEAFARTLEVHAQAVHRRGGPQAAARHVQSRLALDTDPDIHGLDDDEIEAEDHARTSAASAELPSPSREAAGLLESMRALAERTRRAPDAKTLALMEWLRRHLCPAIGQPSAAATPEGRAWTERRVILFTEYGDTKRYLHELLTEAVADTERGDQRILTFHGGMDDDKRAAVQHAFNSPPAEHPVRILIATDAAREGINLQAHCADLFHMDIPWNPARLDQRNGRIDRTLQPAPEVRCHYFVYPDRPEDRVMDTLVRKVETVRQELGSLGAVLLDQMESLLAGGIAADTAERLHAITASTGPDRELHAQRATVTRELEAQRADLDHLREDIHRAGRRLDASRKALQVDPASLRGVVDVGLALAGAAPLEPLAASEPAAFVLPALDRSWDTTLDTLRPPRERDEPFWEWRNRPPRPVTFEPLERLTEDVEQLHLSHPFVKRILDRFLAQGFSAHDLGRASAVIAPGDSVVRVVAYARLSLFGPGAARLHDEILALAAPWQTPGRAHTELTPYRDPATARTTITTVARLLAGESRAPARPLPEVIAADIAAAAPALYASLWPALEDEADARAVAARNGLAQRARREADELRTLLEEQRQAIERAALDLRQGDLLSALDTDRAGLRAQRRQARLDLEHLEARRAALDRELDTEPAAIAALYDVRLTRLSPVGIVVSWPEALL